MTLTIYIDYVDSYTSQFIQQGDEFFSHVLK